MKDKCLWQQMQLFDQYSYGFCPNKIAWDAFWKKADIGISEIPPYPTSDGRTTYTYPGKSNVVHDIALVTINHTAGREPYEIAALLVHEAVHIKQAILEAYGEDNVGDETEAYMVQRISMDLFRMYIDTRVKHD